MWVDSAHNMGWIALKTSHVPITRTHARPGVCGCRGGLRRGTRSIVPPILEHATPCTHVGARNPLYRPCWCTQPRCLRMQGEVCDGGPWNRTCLHGHEGPMCGICDMGTDVMAPTHYRDKFGACVPCGETVFSWLAFLTMCGTIALLWFCIQKCGWRPCRACCKCGCRPCRACCRKSCRGPPKRQFQGVYDQV